MMIQSVIRTDTNSAESDYLLRPNVIFLLIQDGSGRLLDLGGNFYAISQIGAEMLSQTLKFGTAIAAAGLADTYQTELSCIQKDIDAFLQDLENKGLISRAQGSRRAWQGNNLLLSWIILPLLHCIAILPISPEKRAWMLLTLAALSIRFFGWPRTIALWQRSLQDIAPLEAHNDGEQSAENIDAIVRSVAARHPLHVECKERSLSCWWLLCALGLPARLVLGVSLFPLECHCWCEAGSLVLSDDADRCDLFTPILSYEAHDGSREQS